VEQPWEILHQLLLAVLVSSLISNHPNQQKQGNVIFYDTSNRETQNTDVFFLFADVFCSCPGYVFIGGGELEVDYHVQMGIRNRLIGGS